MLAGEAVLSPILPSAVRLFHDAKGTLVRCRRVFAKQVLRLVDIIDAGREVVCGIR